MHSTTSTTYLVPLTLLVLLLLTHLALAIPARPVSSMDSHLLRLGDADVLDTILPKNVTPNSVCGCAPDPDPISINAFEWSIEIPGQMMPSAQGTGEWGGGFLDNLRGQCGAISMWTVSLDGVPAPNTGLKVMFLTSIFCKLKKVQDAAWLASDANNRVVLGCDWSH